MNFREFLHDVCYYLPGMGENQFFNITACLEHLFFNFLNLGTVLNRGLKGQKNISKCPRCRLLFQKLTGVKSELSFSCTNVNKLL